MEQDYKIKVGITQGDINGVGYEVILKTLSDSYNRNVYPCDIWLFESGGLSS